jgi:hypothetical protein
MTRFAQIACAATVMVATAAPAVRADPINITGGFVFIARAELTDLGELNIVGTQDFSLTSRVSPSGGSQGPFERCNVPECSPGTRIAFDIGLSGSAGVLPFAVMTIGNDRYDDIESQLANANVFLNFTGSIIAPEVGPARVSLSAPFSLTGSVFAVTPEGELAHDETLAGSGVGTLTLVPFPTQADFPPGWLVESVRFDFGQPTPEPSTLLLLGTCAAGLVRARRSRQSSASQS